MKMNKEYKDTDERKIRLEDEAIKGVVSAN